MLSDHERTRLLDIERQIQSEDPDLARSFQGIARSHRRERFSWWMYTAAMTFMVLMSLVMVLAGLPAGSLMFAAGTWGIAVARRAHVAAEPKKDAAQCIPDGPVPDLEARPEANSGNRAQGASVSDRGAQVPIVVGVDGSPSGQDAVVWAAGEAAARRRPLRVVHAIRPPSMRGPGLDVPVEGIFRAAAEVLLDQAKAEARSAAPGLEVHGRLMRANAPLALLEQSRGAELLVLGQGRCGLAGRSVGLAAFELATGSSCPVVIMGSRSAQGAGPSAGRVVVGVDD
ncbi:MAG: universal stress protein, partial [Nocardioidaceae bacterium]